MINILLCSTISQRTTLTSKIMQRRRRRQTRSSIGSRRSSLGTPHASRLPVNWTSEEDGTDADGEGDLPEVGEAEEPGDSGTDADIEPRSPPEAPTVTDEEFIVDDYCTTLPKGMKRTQLPRCKRRRSPAASRGVRRRVRVKHLV